MFGNHYFQFFPFASGPPSGAADAIPRARGDRWELPAPAPPPAPFIHQLNGGSLMHRYVLFVSLLAALFPWGQAAGEEPPLRLLVPAYFYPAGDGLKEWNRLLASAARAPITAIVNPDSGPGKKADENYRQLCQLAKKSKISLIGYVTLSYGKRPVSAVKGEIDSWLYFYPEVVGIFFDEQPSQAVDAPFAKECFAYAQQKIAAAQVVANPGVPCAAEYLAGRQPPAVCLFEHETGFAEYQPPEWSKKNQSRPFHDPAVQPKIDPGNAGATGGNP